MKKNEIDRVGERLHRLQAELTHRTAPIVDAIVAIHQCPSKMILEGDRMRIVFTPEQEATLEQLKTMLREAAAPYVREDERLVSLTA